MDQPVKLQLLDPALTDRRRWLGGSDVAAVMGLGAVYQENGKRVQQTPYTVWAKKTATEAQPIDEGREKFLRRRKRWEEPIVEMLREDLGAEIVGINRRYQDAEHPFMAAEIDFEWRRPDGSIGNGEIKTVHPLAFRNQAWGEEGSDEIPVWYFAQCMHGLGVTGRDECVVAVLVGLDSMLFYRIQRDEETIADMRAECVRFWTEHVLAGKPPRPQTSEDVKRIMLRLQGRPVALTEAAFQQLVRLDAAKSEARVLEEEIEELSFAVGDYVCEAWQSPNPYNPPAVAKATKQKAKAVDALDNAALFFKGLQVATWNKQGGAFLDQRSLKARHPEVVAEFTRPITFRVLRIKTAALTEEK